MLGLPSGLLSDFCTAGFWQGTPLPETLKLQFYVSAARRCKKRN